MLRINGGTGFDVVALDNAPLGFGLSVLSRLTEENEFLWLSKALAFDDFLESCLSDLFEDDLRE